MLVLRLAIATPLRRLFDYLPPESVETAEAETLLPGCRLRVPFGRREVIAVLLEVARESALPTEKLRPALEVLDKTPLISGTVLALCRWAADYYHHPEGEVLAAALPTTLRQRASSDRRSGVWGLTREGQGLPDGALKRAPKQAALLATLQQTGQQSWESLAAQGHSSDARRALFKKGLIEERPDAAPHAPPSWEDGPSLSTEQAAALDALSGDARHFGVHLLHGVTGSGKTEVYLRLIADTLARGQQALLLVPEIGLTPQLADRLGERFEAHIALLHSGLGDAARVSAWEAARSGRADIVVGTRSAVFSSLARPGLIIVDEEHDGSFKQQEGFRYSARDLAVKRGQLEDIPVVLGSATPSLESLHNAHAGRYRHLRLTQRIGKARLPHVDVLDVRSKALQGGMSEALLHACRDALDAGNQVLLFLNRRGYAPTLQCHDCGFIAQCRHCDARLTLHRARAELRCHHCEWRVPLPQRCPQCGSSQLNPRGIGTEQAESVLAQHFPAFPVYRVDRDSMQRKDAMAELSKRVNRGNPCILLGTQMLTKGHHFPGITLVGLLDTDSALFSADFRGPERMGQLLTQVAGRAGREDRTGRVILQTHYPDHPLLQTLLHAGYDAYADALLEQRQQQGLPPFGQLLVARAEADDMQTAERFLADLRQHAEHPQVRLIGPLPAPMQRKSGKFRAQLLAVAQRRADLQVLAGQLVDRGEVAPESRRLRWSIDVDALDTG
ncbi:MAG: primosomal protein N' [Pseudomonadota bacterium]